jgi:hypothetical protein
MSNILKELNELAEMTARVGGVLLPTLHNYFLKYVNQSDDFKHDGDLEKHTLDQEVYKRKSQDHRHA